MAIFFFLIGLEIKREFMEGELSSLGQVALPGIAAIGGMVVPALIYAAVNLGSPENLNGWAIPAATDIAFALAVLSLMGNRVPSSLKILLLAIAIFDDLGAILIIAIFYTADLSPMVMSLAIAPVVMLVLMNLAGVRNIVPYVLVGGILWAARSGRVVVGQRLFFGRTEQHRHGCVDLSGKRWQLGSGAVALASHQRGRRDW